MVDGVGARNLEQKLRVGDLQTQRGSVLKGRRQHRRRQSRYHLEVGGDEAASGEVGKHREGANEREAADVGKEASEGENEG